MDMAEEHNCQITRLGQTLPFMHVYFNMGFHWFGGDHQHYNLNVNSNVLMLDFISHFGRHRLNDMGHVSHMAGMQVTCACK